MRYLLGLLSVFTLVSGVAANAVDSFEEYCDQYLTQGPAVKVTMEALLHYAGTENCARAEQALNKKALSMRRYQIATLEPFGYLDRIENLEFFYTYNDREAASLAPLAKLKNLRTLRLLGIGEVKDFGALSKNTKLTHLVLSSDQFSQSFPDYPEIGKLVQLTHFEFTNLHIKDYAFVAKLKNLVSLSLGGYRNTIPSVEPLLGLKKLKQLRLTSHALADVHKLAQLKNQLVDLTLKDVQISDISFLKGMNLSHLRLRAKYDFDFRELSQLVVAEQLKTLEISVHYKEGTLSSINRFSNLRNLTLWGAYLKDVDFLKQGKLKGLEALALGYNQLADLSFLKFTPNLKTLDIRNNPLAYGQLKKLAGLKSLRTLHLPMPADYMPEVEYVERKDILRRELQKTLPALSKVSIW